MNFEDLKSMILNTKRLRKSKNASELKDVNPTSLLFKDYFTEKVVNYTNKYYYEDIQIRDEADDPAYLGERKLWLHQFEDREIDLKYNDINAPLQIHTFGCSWTYGWDIPQEQAFTHLLGDENTSVWNHGAGKTGLDWSVKKLTEVYRQYKHYENDNFIYVITIPHSFRRMHFDEMNIGRRTCSKQTAAAMTDYNHYLYFLHHYEIVNRLIGSEKVIWGTWDEEIPEDKINLFFNRVDNTGTNHPGPESHRLYAEGIRNLLKQNGWYGQES